MKTMNTLRLLLAGLVLALFLGLASLWAADLTALKSIGFSALTIAIVGGIILGNTAYPKVAKPCHEGIAFAKTRLLRLGIILFGFRLTFQDVAAVGFAGVLIAAVMLGSTFMLAWWLGHKRFGMDEDSVMLIGAGSSICGAAAVLATVPVLRPRAEKVAVAVATVVVFGTVAMFLYPVAYHAGVKAGLIAADDFTYGIYTGATVHEVAQVVAAGKSISDVAASNAVITKMIRVMMLAPFLFLLSSHLARRYRGAGAHRRGKTQIPWFAVMFIVVVGFNSLGLLAAPIVQWIITLDILLLATAMAALGLTTHVSAVRQAGVKPLALAAALFAWLIVGGKLITTGILAIF
jgi:uncharacterized integral membrane protein (TIGR00698 family)